jgi:ATP-dependent RNA helicase RhlE
VFSRTKHGADKIARKLKAANHSVAVLHANRSQNQRVEALAGFKSGKYEVMVATDIAARGIDVSGVSHVINYDIPANPEDYVHRIGRTGRAMAVGDAFTLVTPEQAGEIRAIERFIGQKVPQLKLEGFDYHAPPTTGPAREPRYIDPRASKHGHRGDGHHQSRQPQSRPPQHATSPSSPAPQPAQPQASGQGHNQPQAPRKFGALSRGRWRRR